MPGQQPTRKENWPKECIRFMERTPIASYLGTSVDQVLLTADRRMSFSYVQITYSADAGAPLTVDIVKVAAGSAKTVDTAVLTSTFDLEATANTAYELYANNTEENILEEGDSLKLRFSGNPGGSGLNDFQVTVVLETVMH